MTTPIPPQSSTPDDFMAWVAHLPELGAPIQKDRARLVEYIEMARAMERRAAELRRAAGAGQAALVERIRALWNNDEIRRAQALAGRPSSAASATEGAYAAYREAGQVGVEKFASKAGITERGYCHSCASDVPVENGECLVCGQPAMETEAADGAHEPPGGRRSGGRRPGRDRGLPTG